MSSPVIRIRDLAFRYGEGDFELRIPELEVGRASSAAFIGPSGSGKTTLLHLIAGITLPQSGQIFLRGTSIRASREMIPRKWICRPIAWIRRSVCT